MLYTTERIDLMQRFLKSFSQARIKALLADREFVGKDWFTWLQTQRIPFHIRLRRHTLIPNRRQGPVRADVLFDSLAPGPSRHLVGPRSVWGCVIAISAWRLADGDFLIIASSGAPQSEAFTAYGHRWERETLFGALKSRGFNFEDTHLTHPERLSQWLALLAVAFAWTCPERSRRAYRTGEALAEQKPIPVKKRSSDPSCPFSATGSISSAPLFSTGLTARPISHAC